MTSIVSTNPSLVLIAFSNSLYVGLMSNIVASLPIRQGQNEWQSENDTSKYLSKPESLKFISGSELNPVSSACMCFAWSLNASSTELNPPFAPKSPKCGVHACAGITSISVEIFLKSSTSW